MITRQKIFSYFALTAALFTYPSLTVYAGNGGSGYSRYGIGDIGYFASSRAAGMGGAGFTVLSTNSIDQINPAAWSKINRTRFSIGGVHEGILSEDGLKSGYKSSTFFNGLTVAVPLSAENGIVLAAVINNYSRINYNVVVPGEYEDMNYSVNYTGDGGLTQTQLGLSWAPVKDLSIGARLNYSLGPLNYSTRQIFGTYEYSEVIRSIELDGMSGSFGVVYGGLKSFLRLPESRSFNIGAVFTTASYLSSKEEKDYYYRTPTLITRDTVITREGKVRIPYSVGIGASYLTEKILIASDFYYQNWSSFAATGVLSQQLRDSYRLSLGAELQPRREYSSPFFTRWAYRLGFFFNSSYYRINGKPINETGFTSGFGIPIYADNRIDIGFDYVIRGTTDLHLQKDNIFRLTFVLSGSELWFVRPEIE